MGKYIIDLMNPDCVEGEYLRIPARIAGEEQWLVTKVALTPYTEPDMEKVREEAYEDGYKTAKVQCNIQAEKDLREVGERHYQKGLSDAWEAATKIANMPYGEEEKAFGSGGWAFVEKHTAAEAIEKIRQYEHEKDRQARIEYNFDEIKDVLETTVKECNVSLDEIAEVLQKMKEENDNK